MLGETEGWCILSLAIWGKCTQEISQESEWEWKKDTVDTTSWKGLNSTLFRHEIEESGE